MRSFVMDKTEDTKKVYIAGIGPGDMEFVTPYAKKMIEHCDVLVGGKRNLQLFKHLNKEEVIIGHDLEKVVEWIQDNRKDKAICVLATGDPGIFSISRFLKEKLSDLKPEMIPGISSLQYFCCKLGTSWEDVTILSVHGREQEDLFRIVSKNQKTAIFTGGGNSPADVCRQLIQNGICDVSVTVGERLSYPEERIVCGTPAEILQRSFDSLSLMMVENPSRCKQAGYWAYQTHGIPDHLFKRGEVPMTKEEVRTVSLTKLRLKEDSIVFDIGAGTGSVSVECARISCKGKVFAIERKREAMKLIRQNMDRFAIGNIIPIEGDAPFNLHDLPVPDRVFIGGTGGYMNGILQWISKNTKKVRVVVNAITPESVYEALGGFKKWGFQEVELVNVFVSKGHCVGGKHIMKAMNPIYIISAEKNEKNDNKKGMVN